jgi:integrase
MNDDIMKFSSDWFYHGQVESDDSVKHRSVLDLEHPIQWIDGNEMLQQVNEELKDEEKLRTRRNSLTSTINKRLKSISKKAQLEKKVTFHMARHSWAVNALEQGLSISMISSLLGHTSTMVSEKVYAEFRQNTKAEAVNKLKFNL